MHDYQLLPFFCLKKANFYWKLFMLVQIVKIVFMLVQHLMHRFDAVRKNLDSLHCIKKNHKL